MRPMTTHREPVPPAHHASWPLADGDLARRLERAEGSANVAFVEARAALDPQSGASWISAGGIFAMYDGAASPLTQTFGLGMVEPVTEAQLDRIEAFFAERGAPVSHEVAPFLPSETLALLSARGYRPIEHSTVLIRPAVAEPDSGGPVRARAIDGAESGIWARIAAEGWSTESEELAAFVESFGRLIVNATGVHCFLAERDGEPIAAAALAIQGDVALLAGAGTIPSARRAGAQRALLAARLRFAAAHRIPLAMMVAQPGSGSQRNAERQGFRVAYTRTKWQRHP